MEQWLWLARFILDDFLQKHFDKIRYNLGSNKESALLIHFPLAGPPVETLGANSCSASYVQKSDSEFLPIKFFCHLNREWKLRYTCKAWGFMQGNVHVLRTPSRRGYNPLKLLEMHSFIQLVLRTTILWHNFRG